MARNRQAKENDALTIHSLKVIRAKEHNNTCFVDLEINGVSIYGCRYVEGKNGDFISFPSYKGKDGNYYNYAYAKLDAATVQLINEEIDKLLS